MPVRGLYSNIKQISGPVALSVTAFVILAVIGSRLQKVKLSILPITAIEEINYTATMQLYGLAVSSTCLLCMFLFCRPGALRYFRLQPAVSGSASVWRSTGPVLAIILTLSAIGMMLNSVITQHGVVNLFFWKLLPLVVLLAAANAWSEEIVSRFVIVAGLYGKVKPGIICITSGVIFGAAHYAGTPGGIPGMVITGFLGWGLAKSVLAAQSLLWALIIHFLLDLVIFTSGAMVIAGTGR